jgi:hypothetical protein
MAIADNGVSNKFFITVVQTISETSELYYFNGLEQVSVSITPDDIKVLSTSDSRDDHIYQLKSSNISIKRSDIRGIIFGKQFLNVTEIENSSFLSYLFRNSTIEEIDHLDLSGLSNVKTIGDDCFNHMFASSKIKKLPFNFTLPQNIKTVLDNGKYDNLAFGYMFYECKNLESLPDVFNLPQKITNIPVHGFA